MHSIDAAAALEHLAERDAVMARIIDTVGPFGLRPDATDPCRRRLGERADRLRTHVWGANR